MLPNKKFIRIAPGNIEDVKAGLAEGGYLVTATAEKDGRYRIYLLNKPSFESNNTEILIRRNDRIRQKIDPLILEGNRGRMYRLNKKEGTSQDSLQRLTLTPQFEFEIAPIRNERLFLDDDPYILFVREGVSLQAAFNDIVGWLVQAWNKIALREKLGRKYRLSREDVRAMVLYMLDDLRTGLVLKANTID